jgi:hypothetical protein
MQDSIDVLPEEVIEPEEFEVRVNFSVGHAWIHMPDKFSGKVVRVRVEVIEEEGK